jgi:hypothetical protein
MSKTKTRELVGTLTAAGMIVRTRSRTGVCVLVWYLSEIPKLIRTSRRSIILEAPIDPLGGAALVVAHVLGKRVAGVAPAPRLGRNCFLATPHVAGMRVDDRHVTEGEAPEWAIVCTVHNLLKLAQRRSLSETLPMAA